MGIFSSIKDAIFGKDDDDKRPHAQAPTRTAPPAGTRTAPPASANPPQRAPISEVDVEARLDAMPGADALNWRTSIVDLMKLIKVDSSYEARKELAQELGDTNYSGSAEDNIALHDRTMRELAKNGGRVPANFVD